MSDVGSDDPPVSQIFVPDACVGVKWDVPKADSEAASRLLGSGYSLHVPGYFFTEVAGVLQRKVAVDRVLSEDEALNIHRLSRTVPMVVHKTEGLVEAAIRYGIRHRRPVYDGPSPMLAVSLGGRVVTADGRLYRGIHGGPPGHAVAWVTDPF